MARPVDTNSETALRAHPLAQEPLLTSSQIATWLGQHPATVIRWRNLCGFPSHTGTIASQGTRGGSMTRRRARKGIAGWSPAVVLDWLRSNARLTADTTQTT